MGDPGAGVDGIVVHAPAECGGLSRAGGVGPREHGRQRATVVVETDDAVEEARDPARDDVRGEGAGRGRQLVEGLPHDVEEGPGRDPDRAVGTDVPRVRDLGGLPSDGPPETVVQGGADRR